MIWRSLAASLLVLTGIGCQPNAPQVPVVFTAGELHEIRKLSPLPELPPSPTNRVADDPEAAQLGQRLFFDARLSANGAVSCATCHATRKPNFDNKTVTDLNEFHNDLPFSHGTISCLSCHNSEDYSALKLADGSRVEFSDVMTLCAQCHGPQMRDYQHGAHGGMNGHWDLSRGPQMKNNCIDCHDPHAPSYPKMIVGFKPKDRFNEPSTDDHEGAASHDDH